MTFVSAAIEVLRRSGRPMAVHEITTEAIRAGLLTTQGKTPAATMTAQLYLAERANPEGPLERVFRPGAQRAVRGSVRWRLRGGA